MINSRNPFENLDKKSYTKHDNQPPLPNNPARARKSVYANTHFKLWMPDFGNSAAHLNQTNGHKFGI